LRLRQSPTPVDGQLISLSELSTKSIRSCSPGCGRLTISQRPNDARPHSTSTAYNYRRYDNLLLPEHGRSAPPCKESVREPGCYFGGITLRSGQRGFAVYRDGKVVAQYTEIGWRLVVSEMSRLRTVAVLRYGQYDSDGILVFPGNGELFAGDFDSIRRGELRFRHIDKENR